MYFILYILLISAYAEPVWSFDFVSIYFIAARITTLMSISDGLKPYFFRPKMENTRSMKEEMDGEVFISRQIWHFSLYRLNE